MEWIEVKLKHPDSGEEKSLRFDINYLKSVIEEDPDRVYDKLGEEFCNCQPVGETNVIDCGCGDYLWDFEIESTEVKS